MLSVFVEGLTRQGREALAAQIALWDDSGIWTSAYAQVCRRIGAATPSPTLPRDHDTRPVAELRVLILARLLDTVGNRFPDRLSVGRLHELGLTIEHAAVRALAETDKAFTGTTTDDMTRHMLHKAARVVEEEFQKANEAEQRAMAERIAAVAEAMEEGDRAALRQTLGVDDLSADAVRKVMLTSGMSAGLATLVSVGGFASYTMLTSAIAAVAGAVGVTLPFGFYMTATSALAMITSPMVIGPLGLVVVGAATVWGNKKIHQAMLPMIVTQTVVAAGLRTDGDPVAAMVDDHAAFVEAYKFSTGREMVARAKECPGLWRVS
ncbi:hypothetical protein [Azospirillum soli]|uniref:hypothetical protein n=1 Tax=Azospirillum soli TaxID=1304799 RepID=UPI001AE7FE13|nr:hypothetical protein [Azospirillum soli]MBP2315563.1 hypothetical protein [Azospirillum soli]